MAEWSIAAVLKTVDCHRSGGSNPSLSADNLNYSGFTSKAPKKEPIFKALLGAFLLSPLKQFAEEGGYGRKYFCLPKEEKGNRQ